MLLLRVSVELEIEGSSGVGTLDLVPFQHFEKRSHYLVVSNIVYELWRNFCVGVVQREVLPEGGHILE